MSSKRPQAMGQPLLLAVAIVVLLIILGSFWYLPSYLAVRGEYQNCHSGYADRAAMTQAIKTHDPSLCGEGDQLCLALASRDASSCQRMQAPDDLFCKLYLGQESTYDTCPFAPGYCTALMSHHPDDCTNDECRAFVKLDTNWYIGQLRQQECKDQALYNVALARGEPRLCDDIATPFLRDSCK